MTPRPRRSLGSGPGASEGDSPAIVLPRVHCNALASLDAQDIAVSFVDIEWIIPAMTAAQWLRLLWADPFQVDAIFPGLVDGADDVTDAILDGLISFDDITDVATEILEEASGYRWWFTLRLATVAREMWPRLGGMMINNGVHPQNMSLGAWCTAAYQLCLDNQEPANAYKFANALNDPPPGIEDPSVQAADEEAFLAAMSAPY